MRRMGLIGMTLAGLALTGCGNAVSNEMTEVVGDAPPGELRDGVETIVVLRPEIAIKADQRSITGTFYSADSTWIVLDKDGERRWVRLDGVVSIHQESPPPMTEMPGMTSSPG